MEIDGAEHDQAYDRYRDEYNFRRSGVVVLRVRNGNEMDINHALFVIAKLNTLDKRKAELGIAGNTKASRRRLAVGYYDPENSLLKQYLCNMSNMIAKT